MNKKLSKTSKHLLSLSLDEIKKYPFNTMAEVLAQYKKRFSRFTII